MAGGQSGERAAPERLLPALSAVCEVAPSHRRPPLPNGGDEHRAVLRRHHGGRQLRVAIRRIGVIPDAVAHLVELDDEVYAAPDAGRCRSARPDERVLHARARALADHRGLALNHDPILGHGSDGQRLRVDAPGILGEGELALAARVEASDQQLFGPAGHRLANRTVLEIHRSRARASHDQRPGSIDRQRSDLEAAREHLAPLAGKRFAGHGTARPADRLARPAPGRLASRSSARVPRATTAPAADTARERAVALADLGAGLPVGAGALRRLPGCTPRAAWGSLFRRAGAQRAREPQPFQPTPSSPHAPVIAPTARRSRPCPRPSQLRQGGAALGAVCRKEEIPHAGAF